MKTALFAAALLLGGTALAQTDPVEPPLTTPPLPTEATTTIATPDLSATTTADASAMTGQTVAPGNSDPEHDARGIAVISDPATAPPGFNQTPGVTGVGGPYVAPQAAPASEPAAESYPACSRTVTDNCVQSYERGRSPE